MNFVQVLIFIGGVLLLFLIAFLISFPIVLFILRRENKKRKENIPIKLQEEIQNAKKNKESAVTEAKRRYGTDKRTELITPSPAARFTPVGEEGFRKDKSNTDVIRRAIESDTGSPELPERSRVPKRLNNLFGRHRGNSKKNRVSNY